MLQSYGFVFQAKYFHFALGLPDRPFVDPNAAFAGRCEKPSICNTQVSDIAILNRILYNELFAVIFIEDHLQYSKAYVFMFSASNKKCLDFVRFAGKVIVNVVVKEKAFIRLTLSMSRHNCIILTIAV